MRQSEILCPGIPTIIDDKTGQPKVHCLYHSDESAKLFCKESGCMYAYLDENGQDNWVTGFIPATITKPQI